MKIGQVLATRDDGAELTPLIEGIDPLPLERMVRVVRDELPRPFEEIFSAFEPASHAASLGQVHPARLRDGRRVAVKVQYPDIEAAVATELRMASLVPGLGPVRRWGFDLDGYRRVLAENMGRELDYRSEANYQARFATEVPAKGLVVPEVHLELCSRRVLVQAWETGFCARDARDWPLPARLAIARTLLETLFRSVFCTGVVHGDPHPGNYAFRRDPVEVVLYDFGCVVEVSELARRALLKLLISLREGDDADVLSCLAAMGFDPGKLSAIEPALEKIALALCEPFLVEEGFVVAEWKLSARFEHLLGELKWWFRAAGPPELFLLLRAFQGAMIQLERLDVALPWWALLKRAVGSDVLEQTRRWEVPRAPRTTLPPSRARYLKVRVSENGEDVVSLAMPAREALRLTEIVPAEVAAEVLAQGIDLSGVEARLRRDGLSPQLLFQDDAGRRVHRVWLE